MARASQGPSVSSSSSALPSPASCPPSSAPRKKKIGALLSSYYNLENEHANREEASVAPASAGSARGGGRAADAASNGASAAQRLQQLPHHPGAGSSKAERRGGGAAAGSDHGRAAVACNSYNPFPAPEDTPPCPDSFPVSAAAGGAGWDAVSSSEAAAPLGSSSRPAAGGDGVSAAATEGGGRSSSRSVVERRYNLGDAAAPAGRQEEKAVAGCAAAIGGGGGGGGAGSFAAAAGGALAAAAAGGLGLLLGEEEEESSGQFFRWGQKEDGERGDVLDGSRDLDSEQFDVRAFFSAAVENLSLRELLQASSRLDEEVKHCQGELQMLVYENYTKFLEAAETVRGVKEDMQSLQGDMTQLAVRAAAIEGSSKELDDLVRDRAASIEELVSFRQLLDKLQILFTLPDVLRWHLSNGDTQSVLSVYLRVSPFLQQQEKEFPTLQRLHLLHAEAAALFELAKTRLRQQLVPPQTAGEAAASSSDSSRSTGRTGFDDSSSGSFSYQRSAGDGGRGMQSKHLSSNLRESTAFDGTARPDEDTSFLSAAAASRVFHLLLSAGEPPRELLRLYTRSRMRLLQRLLLKVFDVRQLLQTTQPTPQDAQEPSQQQQQTTQQQQLQQRELCPDDRGSRRSQPAAAAAAVQQSEQSAGAAATTEECVGETNNLSPAVAARVLDAACSNLNQLFMEPFVAALQDIIRLRSSDWCTHTAVAAVTGSGDKRPDADLYPLPSSLPPASSTTSAHKASGACNKSTDGAASVAEALTAAGIGSGESAGCSPAAAAAATAEATADVAAGRTAAASLSAEEVEDSVGDFLLPLLLRVLEVLLRLVARLGAPAAAVIHAVRTLRAVLLQRLLGLQLPDLLRQRITIIFQNFTYQVLSASVAAAFTAAYFQAAEELAAVQRFCFSCSPDTVAVAAAAQEGAAGGETTHPHSGHSQVESKCFFLDEHQQEAAQQLLSQKEHALLLRGCLAVTDVHKLVEGVCGVRSSLAEKLVVQEVSKWIEGFFFVFIAAVLRLTRDTPAALQDCPRLRAEAEALRRSEAAAGGSSSSTGNRKSTREEASSSSSSKGDSPRKRSGSRGGFSGASLAGGKNEDGDGKTERCYKCCYCWRYSAVEEAAATERDSSTERHGGSQGDDTTTVAVLEKALLSRCTPVEEEVTAAVAAAVVEHLRIRTATRQRRTDADAMGLGFGEDKMQRGHSAEPPPTDAVAQTSSGDAAIRALQDGVLRSDMPAAASHAETTSAHIVVKSALQSMSEEERESHALVRGTELAYLGRTALCCVLLMRLGHSLELHGVSKVVAVAAELFPTFPVDFFIPASSPVPGAAVETAVADGGGAVATLPKGDGIAAAATSAGISTLAKQKGQQHTDTKKLPLVRLRQVLQAALVTYVYLRGCQGAALSTAALRTLLAPKLPCGSASPRMASADAAGYSPAAAAATPAPVAPSPSAVRPAMASKTPPAAGTRGPQCETAREWLALKDREGEQLLNTCTAQTAAGGEAAGLDAEAVVGTPTEEHGSASASTAAATVSEVTPDGSICPSAADSSSSTSTATSSVAFFLQKDVACLSPSQTTTTYSVADRSDPAAVDTTGEGATDSGAGSTAAVAVDVPAANSDAECMPVEVVGLMDTLLLLLHHCDEETFLFLGEYRFSGLGVLLLRSGGVGGVSAALLPGSARLPRRLQAAAAAGDSAAAAAIEQRQHQHVRRLARLFGRQRTAIEKEMERLFARKQPVFSHVSLNRHKTLMAIFKVACRPFLEAVRSRHFTRLEVRQMQVECAAAAESLRDLVASEDGCVVDGLLDEIVASSLRRCVRATQLEKAADAVKIGHCAGAASVGSKAPPLVSDRVPTAAAAAADIRRNLPASAISRWAPAAESSVAAAYTRMAKGTGAGAVDTGEDNDVLLEPSTVEEICNRSTDRYQHLLMCSNGMR